MTIPLPLVAVVTPVYNGGKYLRRTMESVQAQTYPNIVHVLCDNDSTDDTARIIDDFRDCTVPLLTSRNDTVLPLAANWNRAFSHVPRDAAYAKLLCADDLIRREAIERSVAAAESDAGIEVVLSQDVFGDQVRRARLPAGRSVQDGQAFARDILLGRVGWLAYHHFFVRLHAEDRDGRFIDDYWSPDPHVVLRSAMRGKVAYIDEPLAYNRFHADSVTGKELNKKGVQFQLVQMHLLEHFGRDLLGEHAFQRAVADFRVHSARAILRWTMTGHAARAEALLHLLALGGYRPKAFDYVAAVLGWPISSVRWRLNEIAPGERIDEPTFMAPTPLGLQRQPTIAA